MRFEESVGGDAATVEVEGSEDGANEVLPRFLWRCYGYGFGAWRQHGFGHGHLAELVVVDDAPVESSSGRESQLFVVRFDVVDRGELEL